MAPISVLLVDDDPSFLRSSERQLRNGKLGKRLEIFTADGGAKALGLLQSQGFDIVVTDMLMPEVDGFAVLQGVKKNSPRSAVIILTGHSDVRQAVACLQAGASDYLLKPLNFDELELRFERLMEALALKEQVASLESEIATLKRPPEEPVFASPAMLTVKRMIESVADSDFPVLIQGESGTGKEVVANTIQALSRRASGPYIKVNCAGFVSGLLESEMFGHEQGAFTGAFKAKPGKYELAHQGTLFLDEIGDMELGLQAKILRVLQYGTFERVGGVETRWADVRIVAATNKDLPKAIHAGSFREDLYYRLNVINIAVPALRERKEDILILAERFLGEFSRKYGKTILGFDREAALALERYPYPGNVRELENLVARAFVVAKGPMIRQEDLPPAIGAAVTPASAASAPREAAEQRADLEAAPPSIAPEIEENSVESTDLKGFLEKMEWEQVQKVMAKVSDNKAKAAELLGISRQQLYYILKKHSA